MDAPISAAPAPRAAGRHSPWLAAVLVLAGLLGFFTITEPDVFWHLKTGQVILETGRLVRTNLFSAYHPDYPWHNLEWLHQVILAAAFNLGGWAGVAVLKTALVLATAAVVFFTLLRRAPQPPLAAAVTVIVMVALRFRLTERPHLFSHLFMAVTVWTLERSRREGGAVAWLLPPLFALWSNFHPELALGLAYVAAGALGDWLDARRGTPLPAGAPRRHLTVLALSAAATLLNPETYRSVLTPLAVLSGRDPGSVINEFHRASFATEPVFWLLVGAVALAATLDRQGRRWSSLLATAVLAAIGALYVRGVTAFALAAAPVLQGALAAPPADARRRRWCVVAAAGAAACALTWTVFADRRMSYQVGYGPNEEFVPEAAASFIIANDLPPNLYNHYNEGGYLIYRLYPRWRVFQDGRGAAPPEFAAAVAQAAGGMPFQRLLRDLKVMTALVFTPEIGRSARLEPWGVVFWDDTFAVLVRRTTETAALLDRLEYRAYLPGRPLPADPAGLERAVLEMRRNQRGRARPSWRVALDTGMLLKRLGDLSGAATELLSATALAPEEPETWSGLATLRTIQGRSAEAAEAYARARELAAHRRR